MKIYERYIFKFHIFSEYFNYESLSTLLPRSSKVILNDILRFSYIKYFLFFFKFLQSTNQYSQKLSILFHYHKYLICEIYFLNSLGYSLPCL